MAAMSAGSCAWFRMMDPWPEVKEEAEREGRGNVSLQMTARLGKRSVDDIQHEDFIIFLKEKKRAKPSIVLRSS